MSDKPHIYFCAGWWRVTPMPRAIARGRKPGRNLWHEAHAFCWQRNWSPEAQARRRQLGRSGAPRPKGRMPPGMQT